MLVNFLNPITLETLQGTYNRLFFPSEDGLRTVTIANGLKFGDSLETTVEAQIEIYWRG